MSGWLKSLNIILAERGRRLKRQCTQFDISHSLWSQTGVVFLPTDWLGDSSRDSFNCWKTFLAASRIRALAASSSSSSSTKDKIKFNGGQKLSLLNKLQRNVYCNNNWTYKEYDSLLITNFHMNFVTYQTIESKILK